MLSPQTGRPQTPFRCILPNRRHQKRQQTATQFYVYNTRWAHETITNNTRQHEHLFENENKHQHHHHHHYHQHLQQPATASRKKRCSVFLTLALSSSRPAEAEPDSCRSKRARSLEAWQKPSRKYSTKTRTHGELYIDTSHLMNASAYFLHTKLAQNTWN